MYDWGKSGNYKHYNQVCVIFSLWFIKYNFFTSYEIPLYYCTVNFLIIIVFFHSLKQSEKKSRSIDFFSFSVVQN